jgi:hypothetical protein
VSSLAGKDYVGLCDELDWVAPKFPEYLWDGNSSRRPNPRQENRREGERVAAQEDSEDLARPRRGTGRLRPYRESEGGAALLRCVRRYCHRSPDEAPEADHW